MGSKGGFKSFGLQQSINTLLIRNNTKRAPKRMRRHHVIPRLLLLLLLHLLHLLCHQLLQRMMFFRSLLPSLRNLLMESGSDQRLSLVLSRLSGSFPNLNDPESKAKVAPQRYLLLLLPLPLPLLLIPFLLHLSPFLLSRPWDLKISQSKRPKDVILRDR